MAVNASQLRDHRLRADFAADYHRCCCSLGRQGLLSADRGGVRHRHHVVAGGRISRTPSYPSRAAGRAVSGAETRMGTADTGIPVADLHRIPAVLCNPHSVYRQLARPAARFDHDLYRSRLADSGPAKPQCDRRTPWLLFADGDTDQHGRRYGDRADLLGRGHAESGRAWRACGDTELSAHHRSGCDVCGPGTGRAGCLFDDWGSLDRAACFRRPYVSRRSLHHADHHRTPAGIERARGLYLAGILDLAVGPDGRLSVVAAFDRGVDPSRSFVVIDRTATTVNHFVASRFHIRNLPKPETFLPISISPPGAFDAEYQR